MNALFELEVMGPRGRLISPFDPQKFPSLEDVLYSHAGYPRYANHGALDGIDFSTLHHVVVVALTHFDEEECRPEAFIFALTHEYDEMWLGDIPHPTKNVMKAMAPSLFEQLNRSIEMRKTDRYIKRWGWFDPDLYRASEPYFKDLDRAACSAEFKQQFFVHDDEDEGRLDEARKIYREKLEPPHSFDDDRFLGLEHTLGHVMDRNTSAMLLSSLRQLLKALDRPNLNGEHAIACIEAFRQQVAPLS